MTKDFGIRLKKIIQGGDFDIDPLKTTALNVYNKLLNRMKPMSNASIVPDKIIEAYLKSFDYKSDYFAKQLDILYQVLEPRLADNLRCFSDVSVLAYMSIILYAVNTDIETEKMNILFNSIMNQLESESIPSLKKEIDCISKLLDVNATGLKYVELDTSSETMDVLSAVSDFLGSDCIGSPLDPNRNGHCANCHVMTPKELGIDVDKFLHANQRVVQKVPISIQEIEELINELQVDTNIIDFKKVYVTIYDLINIRFCTWFSIIFRWILYTPDNARGIDLLNKVIRCLLETDKKFIGLGYSYLTLVEIALNSLHSIIQRQDYYTYIRAKNLKYCEMNSFDSSRLNLIYGEVHELQTKILQVVEGYGEKNNPLGNTFDTTSVMDALIHASSSFDIRNVNQGNCLEGTTVLQTGINESMSTMQNFELQDYFDRLDTSAMSDIKKLLGESLKLSTMMDAEVQRFNQFGWFK